MVEDTLHGLIAALNSTGLHVVLARAHARPDVLRLAATFAACLGPRKVGVADHLPDGLDAVICLLGLGIIPSILAQAIQVSEIGCVGRTILLSDQGRHALLVGALRLWHRNVIVHGPFAEADGERRVFHGCAVPLC